MRLLPVGRDGLLAEVASTAEAVALYRAALAAGVAARDIVPAARTVLFDGVEEDTLRWLATAGRAAARPGMSVQADDDAGVVAIPTTYDGPDLEETATLLGMSADELVGLHTGMTFTVAFCGFAPGFAYCAGWDLDVPRLASPRPRVEPGSVGLAGEFTGAYPTASPGGWRIVGRTQVALWDPSREQPALLTPGTQVRFVRVG